MKILHTSDWHLGQSFFTKSRKQEHSAFMSWLLNVVDEEGIDAIIVAGDIFDTGTPPSYARELYHQFIGQLQGSGCTLVVLGGNHDSVSVLNESKALLHYLNSHVVASTYGDDSEQVFALKTRTGEVGAILCAVPFIRPRDVLTSSAGQSGTDKRIALAEAIKNHYASLFAQAKTIQAAQSKAVPIIATGHLTALGVSQSESVRDIYIGTLEGFDATGFPPADYIALGHIHRPQKVAGSEHIRYSGSPIPLSFDELGTQKQVMIAHFEDGKLSTLTPKPIPCFQAMQVIKGDLKDIEQQIHASEMINAATEDAPVWLCIEVQTQDFLTDLQQRIHTLLDEKPAELLQLKRMRKQVMSSLKSAPNMQLSELSVEDVFKARLALECLDSDEAQEDARLRRINVLFAQAVDTINEGDQEETDSPISEGVKS
ncbi:exonuclease subunit SbcD [Alteromonas sp. A079]|uniref:exonuclease subunit SbcD n=1 Tax=Alteromonas sp. A079 TaxID=3410268 RepID=UPI003BA08CD1